MKAQSARYTLRHAARARREVMAMSGDAMARVRSAMRAIYGVRAALYAARHATPLIRCACAIVILYATMPLLIRRRERAIATTITPPF